MWSRSTQSSQALIITSISLKLVTVIKLSLQYIHTVSNFHISFPPSANALNNIIYKTTKEGIKEGSRKTLFGKLTGIKFLQLKKRRHVPPAANTHSSSLST